MASGSEAATQNKKAKRRDQTDGSGDRAYEEAPVRFCSMDECFNYKDLKQCGRCKNASYCSVECQRKNWKNHKALCEYNVSQFELVDGEPVFQRNLRHWVTRFDTTLLQAVVRGLRLKTEWERIDQGALMLFMEPRPHVNQGARWRIVNAGAIRNETIISMLEKVHMADNFHAVLPLHQEARARLRASSGGNSDFALVIMLATNTGPDALEGDHPPTFRMKPVDVHRSMVGKWPDELYDGAWVDDLKEQVHNDHPLKRTPPQ
ncbi:hypothetical protein B0H15DRAFT_833421 [Mycena belliarum]|uniref:MYND-type domain-containing protein n=1 Tax=Mycena belliarum TaxID=1033014 RepID=A0AAD6U610_9AGAR|nr:hypothetical protein B0H15DRAFT_833421 [Mycena belliae]